MQRLALWRRNFNWRMLLMRTVVNALALLVVLIFVPRIYLVDPRPSSWILVAVVLGLLNAFVKPIIQFATLRFIFATYGVVVALINAIILILLALLLPNRLAVDSLFWALVGGAVIGIASAVLENLFGLTPPIVSEKFPEVREMIKERQRYPVEDYLDKAEAKEGDQEEEGTDQAKANQAAADAAAVLAVVGQPDEDAEGVPATTEVDPSPSADEKPAVDQQEA
jgi:putative membrane protein